MATKVSARKKVTTKRVSTGSTGTKACRKCSQWNEVKERIRVAELLEKAVAAFEAKVSKKDFTPTVTEYLKLVQLEHEAEQMEAKEIKVTWVDQDSTSNPEE